VFRACAAQQHERCLARQTATARPKEETKSNGPFEQAAANRQGHEDRQYAARDASHAGQVARQVRYGAARATEVHTTVRIHCVRRGSRHETTGHGRPTRGRARVAPGSPMRDSMLRQRQVDLSRDRVRQREAARAARGKSSHQRTEPDVVARHAANEISHRRDHCHQASARTALGQAKRSSSRRGERRSAASIRKAPSYASYRWICAT
jgi:hypothetical protein